MSAEEIAFVAFVVLVGAVLQGSVGFGMGLLASPILILFDPRFVPGPVLLSTLLLTSLLTLRDRHAIDFHGIQWAMVGRIGGTVLAGFVLAVVSSHWMELLLGVAVLFGVVMSVSGLRFRPNRPVLLAAGLLSGLLGTIASIGGPPMALVYQNAEGAQLRGTMSGFFLLGTIVSLAMLSAIGRFGFYELGLALLMLPSILIGFVCSRWTSRHVDQGYTRLAVLVVAAVAGIIVVFRQFW